MLNNAKDLWPQQQLHLQLSTADWSLFSFKTEQSAWKLQGICFKCHFLKFDAFALKPHSEAVSEKCLSNNRRHQKENQTKPCDKLNSDHQLCLWCGIIKTDTRTLLRRLFLELAKNSSNIFSSLNNSIPLKASHKKVPKP